MSQYKPGEGADLKSVMDELHRRDQRIDAMSEADQADFYRRMGFGYSHAWKALAFVNKALRKPSKPSMPTDKNDIIDMVIKHLGETSSVIGTAYRELSYDDLERYIDDRADAISYWADDDSWKEIERNMDGQHYRVEVRRTHDGKGSVLTVTKIGPAPRS